MAYQADLSPLAFWLTKRDKEIAQIRLARFRRVDINPINWATAKRTALNPIVYMMIYIYVGMLIGVSGINYFQLWLKSLVDANGNKIWGITELNAIPMGGWAMQSTSSFSRLTVSCRSLAGGVCLRLLQDSLADPHCDLYRWYTKFHHNDDLGRPYERQVLCL